MSESTRLPPGAVLWLFSCPPPSTNAHHATQKVPVSSVQNAHSRRFASPKLESHSRGRGSTPLGSTLRFAQSVLAQLSHDPQLGLCCGCSRFAWDRNHLPCPPSFHGFGVGRHRIP
jgi:hypothetical protein